jgi:hypothetical protein
MKKLPGKLARILNGAAFAYFVVVIALVGALVALSGFVKDAVEDVTP